MSWLPNRKAGEPDAKQRSLEEFGVSGVPALSDARLELLERQVTELRHQVGLLLDYINKQMKYEPPKEGYHYLADKD